MKQMLLRVPDDLHARLAARAGKAGRSLNAIATEILDNGVADESGDARAALRTRARRLGVLVARPANRMSDAERRRAVDGMRGIGRVLDSIIDEGR